MDQALSSSIAFVCSSTSWGGLEMNVVRRASAFHKRGWSAVLFAVEGSKIFEEGKRLNLTTIAIKKQRRYYAFSAAFSLAKKFKANNVKAVMFMDTRDMSMLATVKWKLNNQLALLYQQNMKFGKRIKKSVFHTLRFKKIDAWITLLPYMKEQLQEMTHLNMTKVHMIPFGVELEKFDLSNIDKKAACEELKIDASKNYIGVMGRLGPKKRQLFVINAFAKVHQDFPNVNLLIVGDPTKDEGDDYYNQLKMAVENNGIADKVVFRSHGNPATFFACIDVFIMSSLAETFGMVTPEAMVAGKPIIGSKSAGTKDILGNGEFGYLFETEDLDDLAEKIKHVLGNKEEANKMARKAQQHAIETFSFKHEMDQLEALVKSLESSFK